MSSARSGPAVPATCGSRASSIRAKKGMASARLSPHSWPVRGSGANSTGAPRARKKASVSTAPDQAAAKRASPFSRMPGLQAIGTVKAASRPKSSGGISPLAIAGNGLPERSHAATTRSGWRSSMIVAQNPPPEWPHRHQGTTATSGQPEASANRSSAARNASSDPRRGSHQARHSSPSVVS